MSTAGTTKGFTPTWYSCVTRRPWHEKRHEFQKQAQGTRAFTAPLAREPSGLRPVQLPTLRLQQALSVGQVQSTEPKCSNCSKDVEFSK